MAEIIAIGWAANLFVTMYIDLMSKTEKWVTAKPFSCQECMGFWIGLGYALYHNENLLIFTGLSSLAAVSIKAILDRIYR